MAVNFSDAGSQVVRDLEFTNPYSDMVYKFMNKGFSTARDIVDEPRKVAMANYERARDKEITDQAQANRERVFYNADRSFEEGIRRDGRNFQHLLSQDEASNSYRNNKLINDQANADRTHDRLVIQNNDTNAYRDATLSSADYRFGQTQETTRNRDNNTTTYRANVRSDNQANADRTYNMGVNRDNNTTTHRTNLLNSADYRFGQTQETARTRESNTATHRANVRSDNQANADRAHDTSINRDNNTNLYRNTTLAQKLFQDSRMYSQRVTTDAALLAKGDGNNVRTQINQSKLDKINKQQALTEQATRLAFDNTPAELRQKVTGATSPKEMSALNAAILLQNDAKSRGVATTNRGLVNTSTSPSPEIDTAIKSLSSTNPRLVDKALSSTLSSKYLEVDLKEYKESHTPERLLKTIDDIGKKYDIGKGYITSAGQSIGYYDEYEQKNDLIKEINDLMEDTPVKDRGKAEYRGMQKDLLILDDAKPYNENDSQAVIRALDSIKRNKN